MGILEQIEKHIFQGTLNKNNEAIRQIIISNGLYHLDIGQFSKKGAMIMKLGKDEYFETEEEMVEWLNEKGWNIKEKHGRKDIKHEYKIKTINT